MQQLVFELAASEPPRLSNFLAGPNAELVAVLMQFVDGSLGETGMLLWGPTATGKTHLLAAAIARAQEQGIRARLFAHPDEIDDGDISSPEELVAIDRVDDAGTRASGLIFTLYNAQKAAGRRLLAASRVPLASLALREDVRTRLGWGLVYEVAALSDEQKSTALAAYAEQRGFTLPDEVVDYLLRHGKRDMGSMLSALAALDHASLAGKRPITVPLLREWLRKGTG